MNSKNSFDINLYISPTGNDETGDGSIEKPFRTPKKVSEYCSNEKEKSIKIILKKGVYLLSNCCLGKDNVFFNFNTSGNITIESNLNTKIIIKTEKRCYLFNNSSNAKTVNINNFNIIVDNNNTFFVLNNMISYKMEVTINNMIIVNTDNTKTQTYIFPGMSSYEDSHTCPNIIVNNSLFDFNKKSDVREVTTAWDRSYQELKAYNSIIINRRYKYLDRARDDKGSLPLYFYNCIFNEFYSNPEINLKDCKEIPSLKCKEEIKPNEYCYKGINTIIDSVSSKEINEKTCRLDIFLRYISDSRQKYRIVLRDNNYNIVKKITDWKDISSSQTINKKIKLIIK